jgi:hypothetical protein
MWPRTARLTCRRRAAPEGPLGRHRSVTQPTIMLNHHGAVRLGVGLVLLSLSPALSRAEPKAFVNRAEAMRAFAKLLKIPVKTPAVSVTVKSTKREEGLIIEDIFWEALDQERPLAYVVRPVAAQTPLPAIVCLHGTGGSRDSEVAPTFGIGDWTRHGDTVSHKRSSEGSASSRSHPYGSSS